MNLTKDEVMQNTVGRAILLPIWMVTTSLWLGPKKAPFPHIHTCVYMSTFVQMCVYVYMCASAYVYAHLWVCVYIWLYMGIWVYKFVCIYVYVYVYMYPHVYLGRCAYCLCGCTCVQPPVLFTLSFEIGSVIGLELDQWVPGMHAPPPPRTGIIRTHHHARLFFMAYGGLNSGPHVYVGAFYWLNRLLNFLLSL